MAEAFEGNTAETTTMLPTIRAFMAAHQLQDVTVVADAGMISAANRQAIEAAQLSFILGTKIPDIPNVVQQWRREHPDKAIPDGLILTQPWAAGPTDQRRDQVVYYQYRAERARRSLHGIDEQVAKAERAVAGKAPVKRNRFIRLVGADKSVKRTLEAKARALGGWKGYTTNLATCPAGTPVTPQFVIEAYHRLFHIEASFRMSKHDLAARPIYHQQARVDRGPPEHRVRRARGRPLRGRPHRLVDTPVRAHRTPLPDRPDPRRTADPHRRGPTSGRPPRGAHADHRVRQCAPTR